MSARLAVLAAGGTGGHMFPAESLAGALLSRGWRIALVTDRRGQAFTERLPGVALHRIPAGRMGSGVMQKALGVAGLLLGTLAAGRVLRALQPAVAIGFGGYPSVPTMLAATRLHIPTALHEQNAVVGRANRLLAPRVARIATAFATVEGLRPADAARAVVTGNPVRPEVARHRATPYPAASGSCTLLVTGGSQGAHIFASVVPAALARLEPRIKAQLKLMQQARPEDLEAVRESHRRNGIDAEVAPFFQDLPERLAATHLVLCRAGASTVAELCVVGRPAILVPYAHAADDHQTVNAGALGRAGAAWIIPEAELTPAALTARLSALFDSPATLRAAAEAAHRLGRPDAAERLADLVEECAAAKSSSWERAA